MRPCTRKRPPRKKLEGWEFAEGDPIIYLVNDYQKELWNGSLGRIDGVLSSAGGRSLVCSLDGAHTKFRKRISSIGLAYAITVHKAQGSQFKRVIVPVKEPLAGSHADLHGPDSWGGTGGVHRRPGRVRRAVTAPPHSHERQVGFSL